MVLINRATFDIIMTDLPRIMQSGDYFEVDELIAKPIQILNRKGYITDFCCSGHPFAFVTEGSMEGDPEHKINEMRFESSNRAYISFKAGICLPTLPPGFFIDDSTHKKQNKVVIYKIYNNNKVYVFIRDILETMEQLYEWAFNLPDFENK